jgi:hypothetical protein
VGADTAYRLTREQVGFDESRIEALFGDRITANCDDIAGPQVVGSGQRDLSRSENKEKESSRRPKTPGHPRNEVTTDIL